MITKANARRARNRGRRVALSQTIILALVDLTLSLSPLMDLIVGYVDRLSGPPLGSSVLYELQNAEEPHFRYHNSSGDWAFGPVASMILITSSYCLVPGPTRV
jgi:hypothetical protein